VKLPPNNDAIAVLLQTHFMTEASDAGLRSPDLKGTARGSSSPDTAAVARVDSGRHEKHHRIRDALSKLPRDHVDVLSLAYGCTFRSRDIDDGNKRRAPQKKDRNWRVLLRESYSLGDCTPIVLATNGAVEAKGNAVSWLLSESAKSRRALIEQEAIELLVEARRAFAAVYVPPEGEDPLCAEPKRRRGRPPAADGIQLRAFGGAHGREIGG
jgi:hypothetical protein